MSVIIRDAQTAYNCLNGVFCIYKGRKMPYTSLQKLLKRRLAEGNVIKLLNFQLMNLIEHTPLKHLPNCKQT